MRRTHSVVLALLLMAAVVATLTPPVRPSAQHVPPLLPRASLLRVAGKAFLPVIADYYWLQAIQAGGKAATAAEYRDISDYAQLVTDLDPGFAYVYQFAGVLIPFNLGRETWVNTRESTAILEKGVSRFPSKVMLRILLAYNFSTFDKDYLKSARILEATAPLPGAPNWISLLVTRLYAQGGDFDAASAFASQLAMSNDPATRAAFEQREKEIALERILRALDQAVAAFRQREGRLPKDPKELRGAGLISELPEDPLGGQIGVAPDGRTYSTSQEHRLEVYDPIKDGR